VTTPTSTTPVAFAGVGTKSSGVPIQLLGHAVAIRVLRAHASVVAAATASSRRDRRRHAARRPQRELDQLTAALGQLLCSDGG